MSPSPEEQFLKIDVVAELLNLSVITVRRRVKDGSLPSVQLAGPKSRILIPRKIVDDLVSRAFAKAKISADSKLEQKHAPISGMRPKWLRSKT